MVYAQHFSTQKTSQREAIPGREAEMAKNNAGGFVFPVDDWTRLDRFLIIGAESGTYYVSEKELSKRNAAAVLRCIKEDGPRVVARTVEISQSGRAPKNNAAIFVLAMCASESCGASLATRRAAFKALPLVCRIFTHLAQFLTYTSPNVLRGRGRGLRDAISHWYNDRDADRLAYQMVKYRNREGWTHRDAIRIAHPNPVDAAHNALYGWVTEGQVNTEALPVLIGAFEAAQSATTPKEIIPLIRGHNLTREMIPNTLLGDASVWEALLDRMPMMAMVRNLGKMSAVGLLKPLSAATGVVVSRLDSDAVLKAKVHPLSILIALCTYQQGHGIRGSLQWNTVSQVCDAMDSAFYTAFGNIESTGKRIMLALDVSGSMTAQLGNFPISCREAAAAMAMVIARTEPNYVVVVFSDVGKGIHSKGSQWARHNSAVSYYNISPRERLDDIVRRTSNLPFAGTDCALPMILATVDKLEVDAFAIFTDNESWSGKIHPIQALNRYRNQMGIAAKMVVVGMTSSGFSIADPNDAGCLDVCGFDTATPQLISGFIAGNV